MSPAEIREMLESCCRGFCPAAVITRVPTVLCQGHFAEVGDDTVTIELFSVPDSAVVGPLSVACVSFHHEDRSRTFMTPIRDFRPPDTEAPRLILELPTVIATADVRRSVRVSVPPDCPLRLEVRAWEISYTPRVLNLSVGGALVQFAPDLDPDLPLWSRVALELTLAEDRVELTGVVRRRSNNDYALLFTEVLDRQRREIEILYRIARSLEKSWTVARRRTDDAQIP